MIIEREVDIWSRIVYVKMHVPFLVRCVVAEKLKIMLPLKRSIRLVQKRANAFTQAMDHLNVFGWHLPKNAVAPAPNRSQGTQNHPRSSDNNMWATPTNGSLSDELLLARQRKGRKKEVAINSEVDPVEVQEITAEFSLERGPAFKHFENPDVFFSPAQILRIARQILLETPFTEACAKVCDKEMSNPEQEQDTEKAMEQQKETSSPALTLTENPSGESTTDPTESRIGLSDNDDIEEPEEETITLPVGEISVALENVDIKEQDLAAYALRSKGYEPLFNQGVYTDIYALHDNPETFEIELARNEQNVFPDGIVPGTAGPQQANIWLYLTQYWAKWGAYRLDCVHLILCYHIFS